MGTVVSCRSLKRVVAFGQSVGMGLLLLPMSGQAAETDATVRELQRQLEARDAIIRDLLRRVENMERRMGDHGGTAPAQPTAAATATTTPVPPVQSTAASTVAPTAPADSEPLAARAAQSAPTPENKASAPGQVTATEEEAERALERTLTAEGALLLSYGQVELEPSFTYARRENTLGSLFTAEGPVQFRLRRNEFEQALGLRAGLPLNSQAELRLPYSIVQQQVSLGDQGFSRTGSGIGDLSVGLANTVLQEKGWQPDVTARVTWNAPTGHAKDEGVPLTSGSGFNQLRGELVAVKRQDPLAFLLSASYQTTFNKIDGVQPGDEYGFVLGALLALSPESSLNLSLQQTFSNDLRRYGTVVNESDQVQSVLNLGISTFLDRQILLNITAGVGLTEDAPDYTVMASLPIRFGFPVP